ncbi:MAG: hypothetical protein ACE5K0_06295 [Candidatus Methanofastidiosia archaeon]
MRIPLPPILEPFENKFSSYLPQEPQMIDALIRQALRDLSYQELLQETSLYHRIFGMKLLKVWDLKDFKIMLFSVYERLSRIEVENYKKNKKEGDEILYNLYTKLKTKPWSFSRKDGMLLSLPRAVIALLIIIAPLIVTGSLTIDYLIFSGLLINLLYPVLLRGEGERTKRAWKPIIDAIEKKPKLKVEKKKPEPAKDMEFGFDDKEWESVWD